MALAVQKDDEVQILTSGGVLDPNNYQVESTKKDAIVLLCKDTGRTIKVHNSRIHKVLKEENQMSETATVTSETTEGVTLEAAAPKVRKTKTPPTPVDFDALVNSGLEVWNKFGMNLGSDAKVQGIGVGAHCVIGTFVNEESRAVAGVEVGASFEGYEIFNTYNGTLGKKGKQSGRRFRFTEKMTREKKIKQLSKKNYVQHNI